MLLWASCLIYFAILFSQNLSWGAWCHFTFLNRDNLYDKIVYLKEILIERKNPFLKKEQVYLSGRSQDDILLLVAANALTTVRLVIIYNRNTLIEKLFLTVQMYNLILWVRVSSEHHWLYRFFFILLMWMCVEWTAYLCLIDVIKV